MKVKIPREIKIAGHWFAIGYEEGLASRHHKYGFVSTDTLVIHVEPTIPDSLKSQTLLHELVHTLSDQFICANAFSEEVVGQIATGIWVMLSDLGIEFDWSEIKEE
ncbi:hypothetical protein LCGC14_0350270 [marine sediment metagenome]|uniref:IrrE N-terminal-like domain-containing protein n=1 Tax=marine sediment metagenome TaxID=412755 RepID=A0A0F9TB76_9ZZZZ